jgi:hypothetical protein
LLAYSRVVLTVAGGCIASGGLYDVCTRRLPPNILRSRAGNQLACNVIRELLRALGGCLIAIGAAVGVLANSVDREHDAYALTLIIILVLPSEGMNAVGMYRVRSPFFHAAHIHSVDAGGCCTRSARVLTATMNA